jgi:hypothetical protein
LRDGKNDAVNKVDLVTNAFLDKKKKQTNVYRYSDKANSYTRLLELVYAPLKDRDLVMEFENNTIIFTDRFQRLCRNGMNYKANNP